MGTRWSNNVDVVTKTKINIVFGIEVCKFWWRFMVLIPNPFFIIIFFQIDLLTFKIKEKNSGISYKSWHKESYVKRFMTF